MNKRTFILILLLSACFSSFARADDLKFKIKNTAKSNTAVFYRISKHSGAFKIKALMNLKPGEERLKGISLSKGDTIAFYGQDAEDQTSVSIKKDFGFLKAHKNAVCYIPIIVPEKQSSNFESLEGLSVKLEHKKVLNFLLKMDSTSMSSLSLLENNFQNIYPLGTFIFIDTKTNRLLVPPLEPPKPSLVPIETTVNNLSAYTYLPSDTTKLATAMANNYKIDTYNNKVKFFNSHLKEMYQLLKQLDQTDSDLDKMYKTNTDKSFSSTVDSPGLLKEIEVNSQVVRKE